MVILPEFTEILKNSKGEVRVIVIGQMWLLDENNAEGFNTYMTPAVMGRSDMNEDESRWTSEVIKKWFNKLSEYQR